MNVTTVLIVDDDNAVRRLAAEVLRTHGISVLLAVDGPDAIQVANLYPGAVHLILTDVMLATINGPGVVRRIRATRPDVDVVYISGYSIGHLLENGVEVPADRFLPEPFTAEQLIDRVRERLPASGHAPSSEDRPSSIPPAHRLGRRAV